MKDTRQWLTVGGFIATIAIAVYMVMRLNAQADPELTGNFTKAAVAEVHDSHGQMVLRGEFALVEEEDEDIERKAALKATGIDADAAGEAEVEFPKTAVKIQEIEFTVTGLAAGATYTFVIDGQRVGTAAADKAGKAELELEAKMPGGRL